MSITREERMRRQEIDGGDDDDAVWYRRGRNDQCYHEDETCYALMKSSGNEPDETTRADAQARWLSPCARCTIDTSETRLSDVDSGGGGHA